MCQYCRYRPFAPFDPDSDNRRRVWEDIIHCTPTKVHKPRTTTLCVTHVSGFIADPSVAPEAAEAPARTFREDRASDCTHFSSVPPRQAAVPPNP